MKKSPEEIRLQLAQGNPLPLLRWGQYNSPDKEFRELCKVYRRLYIIEQRTYRALGVMPYEERPQWHRDLISQVSVSSLYDSDMDNVLGTILRDMHAVEQK